jgi:hypothetical protein
MVAVMGLPAWESPRWIGVGLVLVVGLGGLYRLDRWASDRRARYQEAEAEARREAVQARGEAMARIAERQPRRVPAPVPSLLHADQRQLIATIRSLQRRLDAAEAELAIRSDPDPILSALSVRPLSLSQLAATVGRPLPDVQRDVLRLIHITEQVERVREGRGDWKFALAGKRSARQGIVPARGEVG